MFGFFIAWVISRLNFSLYLCFRFSLVRLLMSSHTKSGIKRSVDHWTAYRWLFVAGSFTFAITAVNISTDSLFLWTWSLLYAKFCLERCLGIDRESALEILFCVDFWSLWFPRSRDFVFLVLVIWGVHRNWFLLARNYWLVFRWQYFWIIGGRNSDISEWGWDFLFTLSDHPACISL